MKPLMSGLFSGIIVGIAYLLSFDYFYEQWVRLAMNTVGIAVDFGTYLEYTGVSFIAFSLLYLILYAIMMKVVNRNSAYIRSWFLAVITAALLYYGFLSSETPIFIINGKIDAFCYFVLFHIILDSIFKKSAPKRAYRASRFPKSVKYGFGIVSTLIIAFVLTDLLGFGLDWESIPSIFLLVGMVWFFVWILKESAGSVGYYDDGSSGGTSNYGGFNHDDDEREQQERDWAEREADSLRYSGAPSSLVDAGDDKAGRSWGERASADAETSYER